MSFEEDPRSLMIIDVIAQKEGNEIYALHRERSKRLF